MLVDNEKCVKCDECQKECPAGAIKKAGVYYLDPNKCILCGHCAAVCAYSAILGAKTLPYRETKITPEELKQFFLNRRSVRRYSRESVSEDIIAQIAESALSSPTASNTMDWQAHFFSGELLETLRKLMIKIFIKNYRLVDFALSNPMFRLFARRSSARPYVIRKGTRETFREYYQKAVSGGDPLLFQAPVMVVLTSPNFAKAFAPVNCALAGSRMMDMAASLGLESCMVGFAQVLLNLFGKIKKTAGIDRGQMVFLVFTLGYSEIKFKHNPIRDYQVRLNKGKL